VDGIEKENEGLAFDADLKLSEPEKILDQKLFSLRKDLITEAGNKKMPLYNLSFNEIKPMIESSKLFEVIRLMPKGGLLHTHSGGVTDVKWVIATARKYKECYVYDQKDNDKYIFGQLAFFEKGKVPDGFVSLDQKLRDKPGFEKELQDLLILKRDNLCTYNNYWIEFEKRFQRIGLLLPYRPFLRNIIPKDSRTSSRIMYSMWKSDLSLMNFTIFSMENIR
jgi:adenosine deaminase CECR1